MADIYLHNPGIQQDQDSMVRATTQMNTAVENFVQLVNANLSSFTGMSSDQLTSQLKKLTQEASGMNQQFGVGTQTLGDMVELINGGDKQAAGIIQGG